ncbi:3-oxoacyl-[acyl-carrier protein] reductase [Kordia periserrulae]|uniref:3-oxoacyl-[acyl-carrier protein] reductase n=1 Tax=Kordia periserrulae TaxID=701523 RepID=A0A2T6C584_9FLAO|nr:SDR family oxidoreductase [Kordia periserrulae]PTX63498.1 3-oxoacyl-[acyl-carrier protein] reductase [Kordia periserrulae]
MNLKINNKNALVCGSTQGIGKAAAIELANLGANVVLTARNEEKLKNVLAELDTSQGQHHHYIVADFQNPDELREKIEAFIAKNHAFHILVNNTGGPAGGPVFNATIEEFERAFTQHLKCNHILVQAVVGGMKEAGYGRIINVISTSVKQPLDGLGVSNTIRGAVANWSKTLANELGQFGITVNNVLPGATATERLSEIIKNKAAKTGKTIDEVSEAMKNSVPAKRFAKPEEIANAIAFLASEAASYINGINVPVDGGRTKSL